MSAITASSAQKIMSVMSAAFDSRFAAAKQDENENAMKFWVTQKTKYCNDNFAIALQKSGFDYALIKPIFENIALTDKKNARFLANYATEKVMKMIRFAAGADYIDPYSAAIVANCLTNSGKISAIGALRSLCKNIETDALSSEHEALKYCARVQASTASTQRSSTRQALMVLQLAAINKGKKDETIELTDSGKALFDRLVK